VTFDDALIEIRGFWAGKQFPFGGGAGDRRVAELEREFGRSFPQPVREYLARVVGPARAVFEKVGNPIDLYSPFEISKRVAGYNWNPVTLEPIEGWSDEWMLIGDEGADPIIIELNNPLVPVLQAMHGEGEWEFSAVAESLPQFLLLACAMDHAMGLGPSDPDERITDDENGFNLNPTAAAWLFPRVRKWASPFYEEWVGVFTNASEA
jgi:cell wall assembly regulator SMI1